MKETGCSPSFEEMKNAVGLKSKSGIHALIAALEERNFIKKLPHKARALEVVRLPKFKPSAIIEEEKKRIIQAIEYARGNYRVAAYLLEVSVPTLYHKVKQHNIKRRDKG